MTTFYVYEDGTIEEHTHRINELRMPAGTLRYLSKVNHWGIVMNNPKYGGNYWAAIEPDAVPSEIRLRIMVMS